MARSDGKANLQTESHRTKEDLALHLRSKGAIRERILHLSSLCQRQTCRRHQFGTKVLPGSFIRYALSGGGWTGDYASLRQEGHAQLQRSESTLNFGRGEEWPFAVRKE